MVALMTDAVTAADAASSTSAWFALGGALGGVLITGVIGLATAILTHRWQTQATERQLRNDHVGRLRQERRECYAAYWSAWDRLMHQLRQLQSQVVADGEEGPAGVHPDVLKEVRDAEGEWRAVADALFLIAGPEVVAAAKEHLGATEHRIADAQRGTLPSGRGTYRRLNEAMRNEIISPP